MEYTSISTFQELQNKVLTYTPLRAIFVFYGLICIVYFIFFRWKLFALKHDITSQRKKCKKKKKINSFWKDHRTLSWFLLQGETFEIIRGSYPKLAIFCIVYNSIHILFFILGTALLVLSIFFSGLYSIFLEILLLYIEVIAIPSGIVSLILRIVNRNK